MLTAPPLAALVDVVAAQGAVVPMSLDMGALFMRALAFIGAGALALILWFLRRLIGGVDALGTKVGHMNGEVKKVSQELFGPNGENGMRSEVKRMSRQLDKHDRLLVELAVRNEIDVRGSDG